MHSSVPGSWTLFLHAALQTGPVAPFIRLQNFTVRLCGKLLRKKAILRPPRELSSLRANVFAKDLVSVELRLAGVASSTGLG